MNKNTISYNEELNTLRQEKDDYKRLARREMLLRIELKDEIRELRAENARLGTLVDYLMEHNIGRRMEEDGTE